MVIKSLVTLSLILGTSNVLIIGDSLTKQAASRLVSYGYSVDARSGRKFQEIKLPDPLPSKLVIALGTNGRITTKQCLQIVEQAHPAQVYLVTLRAKKPHIVSNNRVLHRCADRSSARLIGWRKASKHHPEWFKADGIHLTKAGKKAYARLIHRRLH